MSIRRLVNVVLLCAAGALSSAPVASGAIPFTDVPPAPEPPEVTFPVEGGAVSQSTDSITFAAHEGSIAWLTIASTSRTTDEQFGRPPSGNPELADKVAVVFGGGMAATRVPLSSVSRTLPPGRYWFNIVWTYDKAYETCVVVLAPTGECAPDFPLGVTRVQALRLTQPRSFVIPAPPPAAAAPLAPIAVPSTVKRPARPAACVGYKAALQRNGVLLQRARTALARAQTVRAKRAARSRVVTVTRTRARLIAFRQSACRLI